MFSSSNLYSFVPLFPKDRLLFPCSPKPLGDPPYSSIKCLFGYIKYNFMEFALPPVA